MRPKIIDRCIPTISNAYSQLLFLLIGLLLLTPFIDETRSAVPIHALLFLLIIIQALKTLNLGKRAFSVLTGIAVVTYLANCLIRFGFFDAYQVSAQIAVSVGYAVFIAYAMIALNVMIFSVKKVDLDIIRGGISIYFLFGIFFVMVYNIIHVIDPSSFEPQLAENASFSSLLYFSFTTLTTLGYGDLVPTRDFARILCSLEAIGGQLFLAVFVARLVGLHLAYKTGSRKDD